MSTAAAKRKMTAMEKKESQGGLGRWRLGAHQGSLAWGLSVWGWWAQS